MCKQSSLALYLSVLLLATPALASNQVGNELLIKLKPNISNQQITHPIKSLLSPYDPPSITPLFRQTTSQALIYQPSPLKDLYKIRFQSNSDRDDALTRLGTHPHIDYIQPNYIYEARMIPNDPYFNQQTYLQALDIHKAWDITQGSSSVIIAVIDSGIESSHPDLTASLWQNPNEIENNLDDDGNGIVDDIIGASFIYNIPTNVISDKEDNQEKNGQPIDYHGHGTHIAGIIAANTHNNIGVSGIAPNCKIMAIKAGYLNSANGKVDFTTTTIIESINYAIDKGAHILNMSFGGTVTSGEDTALHNSIKAAYNQNILMIAAVGNDGKNLNISPEVPVSYAEVFGVGAIELTSEGALSTTPTTYTNYGNDVDFMAPGTAIYSTHLNQGGPLYKTLSGTSQSTPQVVGTLGLLMSFYPGQTPEEYITMLTDTTLAMDSNKYGHGIIQPYQALILADTSPPTASHTQHPTADIGSPIIIQVTVSDNIVVENLPSTTLFYRQANTSGAWQTITMNQTQTLFTAAIPAVDTPMQIDYYFVISDIKPEHQLTYPTLGPDTPFQIAIRDTSAPQITFQAENNDYITPLGTLKITITDNTIVNTASITCTIKDILYTMDSSALTYSQGLLTVTLPEDLSEEHFSVSLSAQDIHGNNSQSQLQLQQTKAFKIFGPEGPSSRIVTAPNPFNPSQEIAKLCFQTTVQATVETWIYNHRFELMKETHQPFPAGYHDTITWNGRDERGSIVPNGIYFLILKARTQEKTITKKIKIAVLRR